MNDFDELLGIVERARRLGERQTSTGARLLGHVPHVAPEAWLHVLFEGLAEEDLTSTEQLLARSIPAPFESFLRRSNGIELFSGSLAIFGRRKSYERSGDASWQPYALEIPNIHERPRGAKDAYLFVGSYFDDGSQLAIDCESLKVHRLPHRAAGPILNEWPGFWNMLISEARRLSALFDDSGHLLDERATTTPPNAGSGK